MRRASGRFEGGSMYKTSFVEVGDVGNLRTRPDWMSTLVTPYDTHALGQARSLGNLVAAAS